MTLKCWVRRIEANVLSSSPIFFWFFFLFLSLQSQKAESYHTASKYEGTHWFMWTLLRWNQQSACLGKQRSQLEQPQDTCVMWKECWSQDTGGKKKKSQDINTISLFTVTLLLIKTFMFLYPFSMAKPIQYCKVNF